MLRRLVPTLARSGGCLRELSTTPSLLQGQAGKKDKKDIDDDAFELLPPGCSIADPTYGLSVSDPVYIIDKRPERSSKGRKPLPTAPTSLAAAQEKLKAKKEAKKEGKEEEEPYVYLPPGSSMRDPGHHSMSDPVYYRDPPPHLKHK